MAKIAPIKKVLSPSSDSAINNHPDVNPVQKFIPYSRLVMEGAGMMASAKDPTKPTHSVDSVKVSLAN